MGFHEQLFRPCSGQKEHCIQRRLVVAFAFAGCGSVKERRESPRVANEQRSPRLSNEVFQKLKPRVASVSFDIRRLAATFPGRPPRRQVKHKSPGVDPDSQRLGPLLHKEPGIVPPIRGRFTNQAAGRGRRRQRRPVHDGNVNGQVPVVVGRT